MRFQKLWSRVRIPVWIVLFLVAFFTINSHVSNRVAEESRRTAEAEDKARAAAREAALKARKAFDPATCKHGDRRYVYWAARDQVFRFRYRPDEPVYAPTGPISELGMAAFAYDEVPPAPDPSEPQGCFGNPMRGGSVPYLGHFTEELFKELTGKKLRAVSGGQHGDYALPERLRRNPTDNVWMKARLEQSNDCWQRAPGLQECLLGSSTDRTNYRSGRDLRADIVVTDPASVEGGAVYFYLGTSLAGVYPWDATQPGYVVKSEFDYRGTVRVLTEMHILLEDVNQMPQYFNQIIRYMAEAHIPGYQWPTGSTMETKGRK